MWGVLATRSGEAAMTRAGVSRRNAAHLVRMTALIAGLLEARAVSAQVDACTVRYAKAIPAETTVPISGAFRNSPHCYSVTVPAGQTGRVSKGDRAIEGIGIPIAPSGRGYVYVGARPNPDDENSAHDILAASLVAAHRRLELTSEPKISSLNLGGLPAQSAEYRYRCKKTGEIRLAVTVTAVTPNQAMIFELQLYTPMDEEKRNRGILDELIGSWRMETSAENQHCGAVSK